jgi:hypothetical protein
MKKLILLLIPTLLVACGETPPEGSIDSPNKNSNQVYDFSKLFSTISGKSVSVIEARSLKPGDKVIVTGKVMGSRNPFVTGRASFIIGDPAKLASCDLDEGDGCKTPWDVCCEPSKVIASSTLNIQVLDAEGKVVKTSLKNIEGLTELAMVTVQGTVSHGSSAQSMSINAEIISVKKK